MGTVAPFEIIKGLSFDEYGKRPGVNGSLLKMVHKLTLKKVKAALDGKYKMESDSMDFGTAFHSVLLEGKRDFIQQPATYPAPVTHAKVRALEIAIGDPLPWNNNAGFCKAWTEKHKGQIILEGSEIEEIDGMIPAIKEEKELTPFLSGDSELSIFSESGGQPVKIRVDLLPESKMAPVIDFKKCRSADPEKFVKQMWDLGYHISTAFYLDVLKLCGIERNEFWFVAVEDKYPHDVSIVTLADMDCSFIETGRRQYREAFRKLIEAQKSGQWPSHGKHEAEMFATTWMMKELDPTLR